MRIGAHIDSTGPLAAAAARKADAVQFFLSDPQGYAAPEPHPDAEALRASEVDVYIHAPYLINVATLNNRIRIPSRKLLATHAAAAAELGAKAVIVHGGHVGKGQDPAVGFDNWRKTFAYAAKDGTVVFEDRSSRYTQGQTSMGTFGESTATGEYPYSAFEDDTDPTYTFSQANLTRPGNGNFAPIINAATAAKYGQRTLTQTVQCLLDFDLTQAGIFYTNRYANPVKRIAVMTLNPAANPTLWPVVLGLELSQRWTVTRRNAGVTASRDYYIERISHRGDSDNFTWLVDVQMSPVFNTSAWVLGDATYGVLGTTTTPVY